MLISCPSPPKTVRLGNPFVGWLTRPISITVPQTGEDDPRGGDDLQGEEGKSGAFEYSAYAVEMPGYEPPPIAHIEPTPDSSPKNRDPSSPEFDAWNEKFQEWAKLSSRL